MSDKYKGLRIVVRVELITRDEFDGRGVKTFTGFGPYDAIRALKDADAALTDILDHNSAVDYNAAVEARQERPNATD